MSSLMVLAMLTACTSPESQPSQSPTNREESSAAAGPTSPTSLITQPPQVTDLASTPTVATTTKRRLGRMTPLPLLLPAPDMGGRATVAWRGRRVKLPYGFTVWTVRADAVVGSPPADAAVQTVAWGGRVTTVARSGKSDYVSRVLTGEGARLWWSSAHSTGGGRIHWWDSKSGDVGRLAAGPGEEPISGHQVTLDGVLGEDDVIFRVMGASESRFGSFRRTSGNEATWDLEDLSAVSAKAQLVAGYPRGDESRHCTAVYAADAAIASWVRCFERDSKPAEVISTDFTSDGSRIVVLVRGGGFIGPASMFHVGQDTLLVLDAADGSVLARVDRNFHHVVLEDDDHVLFTQHVPPQRYRLTDEGPYKAWLVRCSFHAQCERVTRPLHASTFTGAVSPVA